VPIRISPELPIQISRNEESILKVLASCEPMIVVGIVFILPEGKSSEYIIEAQGYHKMPGGKLTSRRITAGHDKSIISLVTDTDTELISEIGVMGICIDHVFYEALDVN
jgi:hypothetical protein